MGPFHLGPSLGAVHFGFPLFAPPAGRAVHLGPLLPLCVARALLCEWGSPFRIPLLFFCLKGMSLASSTSAFDAALSDLGLSNLKDKFEAMGWTTFNEFAFSSSDSTGRDGKAFEGEVLPKLIDTEDTEQKKLIPKLRMLHAQAYIAMSAAMESFANPKAFDEKIVMNSADRKVRTARLKVRITGFTLTGHSNPSTTLTDRMVTILVKGAVRYVPWERCTSMEQELLDEPEVKGLRIDPATGVLTQDLQSDAVTDLSTELLWDYALRRRACAGDIGGLLTFETANLWHDNLKCYLLKAAPPGYRKISWSQLKEADQALWRYVQEKCESGTKAKPGASETDFEVHFKAGMHDPDVRVHLQFLPATSSPSTGSSPRTSDSARSLQGQVANLQNELRGTKRLLENLKEGKGGKSGKGMKSGKSKQFQYASGSTVPEEFIGMITSDANDKPICYTFNMARGCKRRTNNGRCEKGMHICMKCHKDHSYTKCPRR